mmetsp:Transcript_16963/g.40605  ORF Transcript_16963/g.40605 Transcript_16963/m.40605 type:complete len:202 (-) Transcript_16963:3354-3959(-)
MCCPKRHPNPYPVPIPTLPTTRPLQTAPATTSAWAAARVKRTTAWAVTCFTTPRSKCATGPTRSIAPESMKSLEWIQTATLCQHSRPRPCPPRDRTRRWRGSRFHGVTTRPSSDITLRGSGTTATGWPSRRRSISTRSPVPTSPSSRSPTRDTSMAPTRGRIPSRCSACSTGPLKIPRTSTVRGTSRTCRRCVPRTITIRV